MKNRILLICWLSMVTIITLDLITTVIALEFCSGLAESNPFASLLFLFGLFGYFFALIFYALFFYLLLINVAGITKYLFEKTGKEFKQEYEVLIYCMIAGVYIFLDLITILSNIGHILLVI